MHVIEAGGMNFPVIGEIERKSGETVPLIEINMMSDERWQQFVEEGAVKHFREWYGREPESVQEALDAQRALIERLEREQEEKRGEQ